MRFHDDVAVFKYADYPMVGNLKTGYVIGLNEGGASICNDLISSEIDETIIGQKDDALLNHLKMGGYFDKNTCSPNANGAYLHVTQNCNLKCVGCYSNNINRNTSRDPDLFQIKGFEFSCTSRRQITSNLWWRTFSQNRFRKHS